MEQERLMRFLIILALSDFITSCHKLAALRRAWTGEDEPATFAALAFAPASAVSSRLRLQEYTAGGATAREPVELDEDVLQVTSDAEGRVWGLSDDGVVALDASGEISERYPVESADFGRPVGLTYDAAAGRLVVAASRRSGSLWSFDLRSRAWTLLARVKSARLGPLAVEEETGCFLALDRGAATGASYTTLLRLTSDGALLSKQTLPEPLPVGASPASDQLVTVDGKLLYVRPEASGSAYIATIDP